MAEWRGLDCSCMIDLKGEAIEAIRDCCLRALSGFATRV